MFLKLVLLVLYTEILIAARRSWSNIRVESSACDVCRTIWSNERNVSILVSVLEKSVAQMLQGCCGGELKFALNNQW